MGCGNDDVLRIAVVLGEMGTGGIEQVVMNYYRHIDRNRVQFDFYVHENSKNVLKEEIEDLGGKLFLIPEYTHVLTYIKTLQEAFEKRQYTIVHIHLNTLSFFAQIAAKRAGIPVRITHNHSAAGKGEIKRNIVKFVLRIFGNYGVTERCACSDYAGKWMWGNKKFKVWPNAIEIEKFAYNEKFRDEIRSKYGISNQYVIGHIGRFVKTKNHDFLIDVFNEVQKNRNDAILMLVGDGDLKAVIENKVEQLGIKNKVIFVGSTKESWKYYSTFDCFVLPSLYEGFGLAALEAQASGLPCYFADTIPSEANLINAPALPINKGTKSWVDALEQATKNSERIEGVQNIQGKGFDIQIEAKKITNWYLELSQNE